MSTITISLAGIPIGVTVHHLEKDGFFQDYICSDSPLFSVTVTPPDIEYERVQSSKRLMADGQLPNIFSEKPLEALSVLRKVANRIFDYDVILFHSSILAVDGRAYLFAAPSGTGKTTHSRLWLQLLPQAHILNGDKPFLKVEADGRVMACGTPWRGKERYGVNEILPLEAICLLERDTVNHIQPVTFSEALDALIYQTHLPDDPLARVKVLQLIGRIGQSVRLYRLGCNTDIEAARVSSRAMLAGCTENKP